MVANLENIYSLTAGAAPEKGHWPLDAGLQCSKKEANLMKYETSTYEIQQQQMWKGRGSSNVFIDLLLHNCFSPTAQSILLMRKWLMRGLISCLSPPKEILITPPPPLGGKLPDKIFIASHPYSSLPT